MFKDETLILYFYADGLTDDERGRVRKALEQDEKLKIRYNTLTRDLSALSELCQQDLPSVVEASLHKVLEDEAQRTRRETGAGRLPGPLPQWVGLAAALSVVFIGGLFIGERVNNAPDAPLVPERVASPAPETAHREATALVSIPAQRKAVFVRGVTEHFERTQVQLTSLDLGDARQRGELLDTIVSQNRFFLKAAKEQGADDVARLLRAFEPLLLSMANDKPNERSAAEIRDQLDFELSATLTKFQQQTSNRTNEF